MARSLETAYAPFRASMLAGAFRPPDDGGWSAELVAAHVAVNNDHIADAALSVIRGEDVAYDNAASVDEAELSRFVERAGDMPGLAREIERSATRLGDAYRALGDRAGTPISVRIQDSDEIVHDGPIPIGAFIEVNEGRHLALHHEQLKALQRSWTSEEPTEFDSYQLVLLVRPAHEPDLEPSELASLQQKHLGHFAKMRQAGFLTVAGPIRGDENIAGICIYRASSVDEARILAEDDPAVRAGRFEIQAMDWFTTKGALVTP
jgi:uncharacterized protein YciI